MQVNGHSEAAWMRYYIDNITRITAAVSHGSQEASQPTSGPSKPRSPPKATSAHRSYTDGNEDSDPEEVVSMHSTPSREPSIAKNKTTSLRNAASLRQASSTTPKKTIGESSGNIRTKKPHFSMTPAPLNPSVPVASPKLKPALKSLLQAPTKSRVSSTKLPKTPVPPRFVERAKTNRGNAWTSEDDRFIAEVITYEIKRDRGTTIDAMCKSMFRQVRFQKKMSDSFGPFPSYPQHNLTYLFFTYLFQGGASFCPHVEEKDDGTPGRNKTSL